MKTKTLKMILAFIVASIMSEQALGERWIVINDTHLSAKQIRTLEKIHCGPIANGNYWLNINTGLWGYAGNAYPQGNIASNCYRQKRRPSKIG